MNPGDWVFGDGLGVVVVLPEEVDEVLDRCRQILEKESAMIAEARARIEAARRG